MAKQKIPDGKKRKGRGGTERKAYFKFFWWSDGLEISIKWGRGFLDLLVRVLEWLIRIFRGGIL